MANLLTLTYLAIFLLFISPSSFQYAVPPSVDFKDAVEAIFSVSLRLQALLVDPTQNFLVSPLSVALLMSQIMLGADHELRMELYNLLSLPKSGTSKHETIHYIGTNKNITFNLPFAKFHSQMGNLVRILETKSSGKTFTLNCSSALFVSSNVHLNKDFEHNLQIYQTNVEPLSFAENPVAAQETINNWASEKTQGVIKSIVHSPLPPSTTAIFTNAIYFKAEWEYPFSFELNTKDVFRITADKTVEVEYMADTLSEISYVNHEVLKCSAIKLPYKNDDVAMYFLLPHANNGEEYDIKKFADKLNVKDSLQLIASMTKASVTVKIPKLKLSNSLSIIEPLEKYRFFYRILKTMDEGNDLQDSFDILESRIRLFNNLTDLGKIDLTLKEAVDEGFLKVSNVVQQVHLTVDEKGTEAAAVTAGIILHMGGSKLFVLDRPFVFMVRHEYTSTILFWGTVSNPSIS